MKVLFPVLTILNNDPADRMEPLKESEHFSAFSNITMLARAA